jgi:RNA polymerase sigma factor (sigma-70 family)
LSRSRKDRADLAKELVATVFHNICVGGQAYYVTDMTAFCFRALDNQLYNYLRHEAVVERTKEEVADGRPSVPSPESMVLNDERTRKIWDAVGQLPYRARMTYQWHEWDGLSTQEIIARFAQEGIFVSERTVQRYFNDAREALAEKLAIYRDMNEEGHR